MVSHTVLTPGGEKKTLGLIYPGQFHFGTQKAERMEIVSGTCMVKINGQTESREFGSGTFFEVPSDSGFDIEVRTGICEYVCSFLG